jgi:uncharacterized protein YbjQ (UPF0145 family)
MSGNKILATNLSFYDTSSYSIIGLKSATVVHAISAARGLMAGFSGIFGGKLESIERKYEDIRHEAMDDLQEMAKSAGADMIAGVEFDISTVEQNFIVCLVAGTFLKKKTKSGGSRGSRESRESIRSRESINLNEDTKNIKKQEDKKAVRQTIKSRKQSEFISSKDS